MNIEYLVQRLDDLVNALERIARVLEDVTSDGRVNADTKPR